VTLARNAPTPAARRAPAPRGSGTMALADDPIGRIIASRLGSGGAGRLR
jgi:hypothetical protein